MTYVTQRLAVPTLDTEAEPSATETLADALAAAYREAPTLQAQRDQLRAVDEDYAQALSELRPTGTLQVTGDYTKTVPGRTTQATRFGAVSPIITANTLSARVTVDQPLTTGGRAAADRDGTFAAVGAGREALRAGEGDLFLRVITSYLDVRRDGQILRLRRANLAQLQATLDEVKARREAGELTRTDIAQAETQLNSALAQYNTADQQLEQDRASFAALVGHDPGVLAPPPTLPGLPRTIDDAFALAEQDNPELAGAIATEKSSRARISAARAQGRPTLSLRGSAELTGQAAPYRLANEDQVFSGQAVLTIPLTNGGRVRSLIAQAGDRNAVDRSGIEAARRQTVEAVINAWNAMSTARRNIAVGEAQLASAQVFDEGTFEEYRAGLRSTFDVLFAHAQLRDAEIALAAVQRDEYVAQAALLRRVGVLEAHSVLAGVGLYDPAVAFDRARSRNALPWDGSVRAIDALGRPAARQHPRERPEVGTEPPAMKYDMPPPDAALARNPWRPTANRSLEQP